MVTWTLTKASVLKKPNETTNKKPLHLDKIDK